jgi:GT2 family glycosyltransferase
MHRSSPTPVVNVERSEADMGLDSEKPEVSIIIPSYNGIERIGKCLDSVLRTEGPSFEIIVVDNGSTDGSLQFLRTHHNITTIANPNNLGFPVAVNQGARAAKGSFLAILNQDTEVDPNWLQHLTSILKTDPIVAICGPKILGAFDRSSIQQLGVRVDRFGFGMYISKDTTTAQDVFMVSGAAMLIRREVFDLIGQFDPDYFMFEDDLDLCWRARLAGYRIVANPQALVYHFGGASMEGGFPEKTRFVTSPARRYYSERNMLRTLVKNYETKNIAKILPFYLGMNLAEIGLFLLLRRSDGARAYLKSFYYNLVNFNTTWRRHLEVSRIRRVPDSTVARVQDSRNLRIATFMKWGTPTFARQTVTSS